MNKLIFTILFSASINLAAQVSFAGKANMIFPTGSPSWENLSNAVPEIYSNSGKNNIGFNIGISAKVDLPSSFFIMPELYYTTFKNSFTHRDTNTTIEAVNNRIDLPVLLGMNVVSDYLGVVAGPVASYNLSSENQYNDFKENATKNFTVGYQFGLQSKISKIVLTARYEGAFTSDERTYVNTASNAIDPDYVIRYDNRPSLIILGIGYVF
ncbi:hypothetical protein EIZ47_03970 [Chryseobacterium lacus]|uniref:Outer membrane protein beta-barrel domain-containing protein n=1 Tax=Chryseobacterium lacus TaxID=2058346 RepID=A0A368MZJ6_9FLAO|nr:outer membrane beta-barrel protein [Chryseobacterium lacus]RCU43340.1 hypothetical protein DQ356_04010 [Chryseobacterium lacus]RST28352.1 hypothetical protein EIZ47_03970 [Chryseobacterium lacus]